MNRKLASVLVSLVFGWVATTALAGDDTSAASADSSASASEPAVIIEQSTDTATMDTSTSDGTIAASPTEAEPDKK